jgi:hypothetical protein
MAISDSDGLSDKTNGILGLGPNQKTDSSFIKKMFDDKKIN